MIDVIGFQFGTLLILRQEGCVQVGKKNHKLYICKCLACGSIVAKPKYQFGTSHASRKKQISCGCLDMRLTPTKKRQPEIADHLVGKTFGELTVLRPIYGGKKTLWECLCSCKKIVNRRRHQLDGKRASQQGSISCGCKERRRYLKYPPTPQPYPEKALEYFQKYLALTAAPKNITGTMNSAEIEDFRTEQLMRSCWILVCRENNGEFFDDARRLKYLKKCLRWGQSMYNEKSLIDRGKIMTEQNFQEYPVAEKAETQENIFCFIRRTKKFQRR